METIKVITSNPVIFTKVEVIKEDNFIPFDGKEELEYFIADDGNEYFYSFDDDTYYNAKGEKVKGFFKKVGGGFKKVGRGIGKGAKAVGRGIAKGFKAIGRALKNIKARRAARSKNRVRGVNSTTKSAKGEKLIHLKKDVTPTSGKTGLPLLDMQKNVEMLASKQGRSAGKTGLPLLDLKSNIETLTGRQSNQARTPRATRQRDTFIKPLKKISRQEAQSMKPEEVIEMNGETYSAQGIPAGKAVTVVEDPTTGQQVAGFEFNPSEVVATTAPDGNIDYHAKDDQKGMSKTTKFLLIGGGVVLVGVIIFAVYKMSKKAKA